MSRRTSKTRQAPPPDQRARVDDDARAAVEFLPAPRPRRGLFAALMGAMVLWVVFLLVLYFTTVYPQRARERWQQAHPGAAAGPAAMSNVPRGSVALPR